MAFPGSPPSNAENGPNLLRGLIAESLQANSCVCHFRRQLQGSGVGALSSTQVAAGFQGVSKQNPRVRGWRNFIGSREVTNGSTKILRLHLNHAPADVAILLEGIESDRC